MNAGIGWSICRRTSAGVLVSAALSIFLPNGVCHAGSSEAAAGPPRILAMAELNTPRDLSDPEPIRTRFTQLLAHELQSAGYEVVPAAQFESVRHALADSLGIDLTRDLSDPLPWSRLPHQDRQAPALPVALRDFSLQRAAPPDTSRSGRLREERARLREMVEQVRRTACARVGAEGSVEAEIALIDVLPNKGKITWQGATDKVDSKEPTFAYSLVITVKGADGTLLHQGAGGIEVATKARFNRYPHPTLLYGGILVVDQNYQYAGQEPIARKKLFRDDPRNLHAVRFALTPYAAAEKPR